MSQALYRKYRSRTLDEILGQDHVTGILKQALKKGKLSHAYLLTGPRGTGKTSIARILAHQINQLAYEDDKTHLDIIEIDAASNNGVDNIRDLREKAQVAPVSAKYKIYIVDEVHMLSKPAFNALLKTLEEPPGHIIFILATTDVDKLPSTILSRVQTYYLKPISKQVMADHLVHIAKQEGFKVESAAAELIADHAKGGFRDSISMLDQLSSLADKKQPLTVVHVRQSLGLVNESLINKLLEAHVTGNSSDILDLYGQLESQGADPLIITKQLLSVARNELAKNPAYTKTISQLIEVTRHPHPDLKLLTILLENQAPAISPPKPSNPAPASEQNKQIAQKVSIKTEKIEIVKEPEPTYNTKKNADTKPFNGEFNWQSVLDLSLIHI